MEYFPVFLNLSGRLCVVIGGGKVAERKINSLLKTGAKVKVISPELTPKLKELADKGSFEWIQREYTSGDIRGAWLVIAATNSPEVQKLVFEEAEKERIFCNVVDVPELCSFIVPSSVKRGALCIAISTSGKAPAVARRLREVFEAEFGEEYEVYIELMHELRKQVLDTIPSEKERQQILRRLALAPILECIKQKNFELLKTIIEKEGLSVPSTLSELLNSNTYSTET